MPDEKRTDQELAGIAVDLVKSLKLKGLTVGEIRKVIGHMEKSLEHIRYGP